jgi:hypothetical protein
MEAATVDMLRRDDFRAVCSIIMACFFRLKGGGRSEDAADVDSARDGPIVDIVPELREIP